MGKGAGGRLLRVYEGVIQNDWTTGTRVWL